MDVQLVDRKLGRLPLRYFDSHPRGDTLSRVTNDIDNIGQTLQQSLTQLITSLLTVVGVLILMLTISPILAVLSLLAVPLVDQVGIAGVMEFLDRRDGAPFDLVDVEVATRMAAATTAVARASHVDRDAGELLRVCPLVRGLPPLRRIIRDRVFVFSGLRG